MAAMLTALTEFSDTANLRTYTTSAHTITKQNLVVQRRRVPTGQQVIQEDVISVIHDTEDSNGDALDQKIVMQVSIRRPKTAIQADINAALVIFRDIVAGDEFGNTVNTSEYLS